MKKSLKPATNTLGDWAYLAIEQHFEKILKHEQDVLKDRHPESLHQMRVGMRRLRSAVTGFAPAIDLPKAAKEEKIGKIARILGKLRDLDVLEETLQNQYQPNLPKSERKCLETVLDCLTKKRKHASEAVQSALKAKGYENLKQGLQKWLQQPSYEPLAPMSINEVLPNLLLPSVSQLFLHPGWLVGVEMNEGAMNAPNPMETEQVAQLLDEQGLALHSLRKQTKRSRYQMELFTDFYEPNYTTYVDDLKEIQSILGQIQDSFVLAEFLTDALDSEIQQELPTLVEQLAQTRYQSWQQWQPLQTKYLKNEVRQALHLELLNPKSPSSTSDLGNVEQLAEQN